MQAKVTSRTAAIAVLWLAATSAFGQMTALGTGIVPARPAAAQAAVFTPGTRFSLSASDNILYAPRGEEKTGILTEVAPFLRTSASTGRAQGSLDVSLSAIHRSAGGDSESMIRHSLFASGNALLIGDSVGIQGSAASFYTNTSAFGTITPNPNASPVNAARVSTLTLAPYVIGRLGTFASYSAQYSLQRTDTSSEASGLLATADRRVYATLASGPQFLRWGWSILADSQQRDVTNSQTLTRRNASATAYYVFSPELRAGGSLNYSFVEGLADSTGRNSGIGPGAFADWTPSRRTTVRASWADQFYGSSSSLAIAHRLERWAFGLNYTRALLTNNSASLVLYNPGGLYSAGGFSADLNSVFQQLLSLGLISPNSVLAAGLINDALVRSRMLTASVGYTTPRFSLAITGFSSNRNSLLQQQLSVQDSQPLSFAFGRIESLGITASGRVTLSPRSFVSLTANRTSNKSLDDGRQTSFATGTIALSTNLNARSLGSISLRRTIQSGIGGVPSYDENVVIATLNFMY